jgi:glucose/arabinose dehydrogenase
MSPSTARTTIVLFIFIFFVKISFAQPTNDNFACSGLPSLTPSSSCTTTSGDLYQSTNSGISSTCGTTYDVWYSFTTPSGCNSVDIDVSPITAGGNNLTAANTFVQGFSASGCSLTPKGVCTAMGTTLSLTGLTPLTTYYVRVFVTTNPNSQSGKWDFDICATYTPPPANDDCSGAVTLTSATSCSNTSGTLINTTATSGLPGGCESAGTHYDVWYKFVASNTNHTIAISNQESNFTTPEIQLYNGTCGSLTSVQCGTTSISSTVLTIGNTYYVRVSNIGSSPASNGGFNICVTHPAPPVIVTAGRMKEVYKQTILSDAGVLNYPWEITYGPDNKLWITESRGYKVYRMDPATGAKDTVLDLNSTSTDLSAWGADSLRAVNLTSTSNWNSSANAWPQGGLAGLAIHPQFLDGTGLYDYVYVSYVHRFIGGSSPTGIFFRNKLVRFTYNAGTNKLESPVVLCDTLPGSSDHNSQRIIIAPVTAGGTNYLFYAQGDMGSGQFANRDRAEKAQYPQSYEGKILRFNLESDGDSGPNAWIPDNNPYNALLGVQSAVYSIGIRNNQGFAYDTALNMLYGSSHGPYSDDEINIIESGRNYGHPLVVGFAADGNVNNTKAGAAPGMNPPDAPTAGCPMITNESANAAAIGPSYKDPLFSGYPNSVAFPSIYNLWSTTTGANAQWPTEAWSGLDLYTNKIVPGWKHSLVAASLKWGRLLRLKLGPTGTSTLPNNNVNDTISYFGSQNRFRDLAFSPDGKDIYVIMDNSSTTSGPGSANPIVPQCAGCVQKYTFLGYADAGGKSTIPTSIDVTDGTVNTCNTGTTITIDATNSNYWVPITGPDGNIMAEIYANGNNLGTVTSSFYKNAGAIRTKNGNHYLNRNMTITPQTQPSTAVKIRLYISKAEFDSLDADGLSGISAITDLKILKNSDPCSNSISAATTLITPTFAEAHGTNGYMLQGNISSFSSFYFSSSNIALPLDLITFSGSLQNNSTVLLKWETENEINTSHFLVERSIDGTHFNAIGTVSANGNNNPGLFNYSLIDIDASNQQSLLLYYRLKIVDIDGNFKYSGIITISLADITGKLSVSPNPVVNEAKVNISSPADGRIQWKLIDNTGRIILQNSEHVKRGNGNRFTINMNKLSIGSYYLSVSGTGIDQKVKLQKL